MAKAKAGVDFDGLTRYFDGISKEREQCSLEIPRYINELDSLMARLFGVLDRVKALDTRESVPYQKFNKPRRRRNVHLDYTRLYHGEESPIIRARALYELYNTMLGLVPCIEEEMWPNILNVKYWQETEDGYRWIANEPINEVLRPYWKYIMRNLGDFLPADLKPTFDD